MTASRRSLLGLAVVVACSTAFSSWWARHSQQLLGERVAALAAPGDVRMLSSESCAICTVARRWFTEHRVAYSECLIERDAACRAQFDALGAPGTPVLVVRGRPQRGFSPGRLEAALQPGA
jgi:glutaredoxin